MKSNCNQICRLRKTAMKLNLSARVLRVQAAAQSVTVNFHLKRYKCEWGETIAIVGNHPDLGAWDIQRAPLMDWREGHAWSCSIKLPLESGEGTAARQLHYKYAVVVPAGNGHIREAKWQDGRNYSLTVPPQHPVVFLSVEDSWDQKEHSEGVSLGNAHGNEGEDEGKQGEATEDGDLPGARTELVHACEDTGEELLPNNEQQQAWSFPAVPTGPDSASISEAMETAVVAAAAAAATSTPQDIDEAKVEGVMDPGNEGQRENQMQEVLKETQVWLETFISPRPSASSDTHLSAPRTDNSNGGASLLALKSENGSGPASSGVEDDVTSSAGKDRENNVEAVAAVELIGSVLPLTPGLGGNGSVGVIAMGEDGSGSVIAIGGTVSGMVEASGHGQPTRSPPASTSLQGNVSVIQPHVQPHAQLLSKHGNSHRHQGVPTPKPLPADKPYFIAAPSEEELDTDWVILPLMVRKQRRGKSWRVETEVDTKTSGHDDDGYHDDGNRVVTATNTVIQHHRVQVMVQEATTSVFLNSDLPQDESSLAPDQNSASYQQPGSMPDGVDLSHVMAAGATAAVPQGAASSGHSLPNDKAVAAAAAAILAAASTSFSAPRSPALAKALENAARHKPPTTQK